MKKGGCQWRPFTLYCPSGVLLRIFAGVGRGNLSCAWWGTQQLHVYGILFFELHPAGNNGQFAPESYCSQTACPHFILHSSLVHSRARSVPLSFLDQVLSGQHGKRSFFQGNMWARSSLRFCCLVIFSRTLCCLFVLFMSQKIEGTASGVSGTSRATGKTSADEYNPSD